MKLFKDTTGIPDYENMRQNPEYWEKNKNLEIFIIEMTPDEYLEKVNLGFREIDKLPDTYSEKEKDSYYDFKPSQISMRRLDKMYKEGEKFDIPFLYEKYTDSWSGNDKHYSFGQEGRHRSVKAKELGIEKIKVIYIKEIDMPSIIGMGKFIEKDIAFKFRKKLEEELEWEDDKSCFTGQCDFYSRKLVEKLSKNGIESYMVSGFYTNIDSSFEPPESFFENNDDEEIDLFYQDVDNGNGYWNHWIVYTENNKLIDITADQFRDDKDSYRFKYFEPNSEDSYDYSINDELNIEKLRELYGRKLNPYEIIDELSKSIEEEMKLKFNLDYKLNIKIGLSYDDFLTKYEIDTKSIFLNLEKFKSKTSLKRELIQNYGKEILLGIQSNNSNLYYKISNFYTDNIDKEKFINYLETTLDRYFPEDYEYYLEGEEFEGYLLNLFGNDFEKYVSEDLEKNKLDIFKIIEKEYNGMENSQELSL